MAGMENSSLTLNDGNNLVASGDLSSFNFGVNLADQKFWQSTRDTVMLNGSASNVSLSDLQISGQPAAVNPASEKLSQQVVAPTEVQSSIPGGSVAPEAPLPPQMPTRAHEKTPAHHEKPARPWLTNGDGTKEQFDKHGRVIGLMDKSGKEFDLSRDDKGKITGFKTGNISWTSKDHGKTWTDSHGRTVKGSIELETHGKPGDGKPVPPEGYWSLKFKSDDQVAGVKADGTRTWEFPKAKEDQLKSVTVSPDGTRTSVTAKGDQTVIHPNKQEDHRTADGAKVVSESDGWKTTQYPDSDTRAKTTEYPWRENPSQHVTKTEYRNGTTVTDYPPGAGAKTVIHCGDKSPYAQIGVHENGKIFVTNRDGSKETYLPGQAVLVVDKAGNVTVQRQGEQVLSTAVLA